MLKILLLLLQLLLESATKENIKLISTKNYYSELLINLIERFGF